MSPSSLDQIFVAFAQYGDRHYGERITQLEHAIQCAVVAAEDGASDSLIAASLLHDYGHLIEYASEDLDAPDWDDKHELVAAHALGALFGPDVIQPIALHVAAKRYLCLVEPGYLEGLSPASLHSLTLQGGTFTSTQAEQFRQLPYAADAVKLRRYDDLGKQVDMAVDAFERYRPLLERLRLPA
jgi:phosphonate degradation associated HDIG domain protein